MPPFAFPRSFPLAGRRAPLALALASGLATSGLLYAFLTGQARANAAPVAHVVVTRVAVDDRHPIQPGDLSVVETAWAPPGSFQAPAAVVGRMPLVAVPIGQPLLSSHLAAPGQGPALWQRVPAGLRAVAVAINEVVGVGGFVKPGLHVDVIGVAQNGFGWESETIAQDVPVLAISQDDADRKDDNAAKIATSATLLVTPVQAEAISLASEKGRIRLVLRAADDHAIRKIAPKVKPKPVTPVAPPAPRVVERPVYVEVPARRPAPAYKAPAPAPAGIQVIRGQNVEVVHP